MASLVPMPTETKESRARERQTVVRTNDKESAWLDELAEESGVTGAEMFRRLLREEMRRRKKRGER